MALMLTLDDAMRVLTEERLLDSRFENEDGYPDYVRNLLEQKCYIYSSDDAYKTVERAMESLKHLTVDDICEHIKLCDLKFWLISMQVPIMAALRMKS